MRKLAVFLIVPAMVLILSGNALAGSLYKAGNIVIGGGYNSMALAGTTYSGFQVQGSYFLSDNGAITLQYESLDATGATIAMFDIAAGWHSTFSDRFGWYASVGSGGGTQTAKPGFILSNGASSAKISVLALEAGVEFKPADNIIVSVGYKNEMDRGGVSLSGITGSANFVF